jgi:hypothetical protein
MQKAYFDKGVGITAYLKYFIAFFALASQEVMTTLIITLGYAIFCYIFGFFWYKYGWTIVEAEIGNNFNLFVLEMRKKIRLK